MSGNLKPGLYTLSNATSPNTPIGVNGPGQPVVANATFKTWAVTQDLDGAYMLAIDNPDGNLVVGAKDGSLTAFLDAADHWTVNGPEGGPYEIQQASSLGSLVWNMDTALSSILLGPSTQSVNKDWYFKLAAVASDLLAPPK